MLRKIAWIMTRIKITIPLVIDEDSTTNYSLEVITPIWTSLVLLWREINVQARTNEKTRQECSFHHHKNRFKGRRTYCGAHSKNICKSVSMFLTFPHCPVEAEVVGRIVNCGVGYGLDIHVWYHFFGPEKAIDWLKIKVRNSRKGIWV